MKTLIHVIIFNSLWHLVHPSAPPSQAFKKCLCQAVKNKTVIFSLLSGTNEQGGNIVYFGKNRLTDKWSISFTKHTSDQLPCFDKVNINTLNRCQLFTSVFLFCFYAQKAEKESAGSFFCNYV